MNITYYLSLEVKYKYKREIVLMNSISAQLLAWNYQTEVLLFVKLRLVILRRGWHQTKTLHLH